MTNEQIIFNERVRLMEENKIGTTGRMITVEDVSGNKITVAEPEEIHTFQAWKALGYCVRKGEKAIAKFTIWKYTEKNVEVDGEKDTITNMFMKTSAFFAPNQVERMKAN